MTFEIVTLASGQGAVDREFDAKLSEWVSLLDYYDDALDQGDYSPALARALAASTHVRIPSGSYSFNSPVDYIENMNLVGPVYPLTDGAGGAVITANNGFLKNPTVGTGNTQRRRFLLSNLEIVGNGTAVGVDGPFGGRIENCSIRAFTNGVRNNNAFLSRYVRTSFRDCTIGINLATANACRIEDCFFGADCLTAIDVLDLEPLIEEGQNSGMPIIICGNNINMGNATGSPHTALKLRGTIVGYGNYFEDYTPNGQISGNIFVELLVNRFENAGFTWFGNEMNGQGEAAHAFLINGSMSLPCDANGTITANRMIGFTGNTIEFGANNRIEKLRIFDNNSTVTVGTLDPRATYRPLAHIGFSSPISIAGSTFVTLPITQDVSLDTADGTGTANAYRARKAGYYKLMATVVFTSTAQDYPEINLRIEHVGTGTLAEAKTGLSFSSGTTHTTASLSTIVNLAVDENIEVQASNGENAASGIVTVEYLGNGSS